MNLLQKRIQEASQKYYTDGTSDVSDAEFDNMLEELRKEDPDSPLLGVGHGYNVELDSTPGAKVKHKYGTAGSLDKCHNWKEFPNNQKGVPVWASLKLDGLSVVLYYELGKLVRALTRGDGNLGIDITEKVKQILPDTIMDLSFTGAVRGEILMKYSNFDTYRNAHPEAKNPRNTAAGLINSKEITSDLSYLDIVVYTVVGIEAATTWMLTYTHMRDWLEMNFESCAPAMWRNELSESNMYSRMEQLSSQWSICGYPSDGIVLSNDHLVYSDKEIIYTASAFKFKAESAVTKVIGIEWNLSKTKYLIPRIHLDTVQLSGTSVSYCAGHNAEYIESNHIGPGAEVEVYKSGEIIPYLDKVISPGDCIMPTECPCCGSKLEKQGVHLMCPNPECADGDVQDVLVWMENIAPWDGLGDTLKLTYLDEMLGDSITIEKIYQHGSFTQSEIFNLRLIKKQEFRRMINALFTNKVKLADAIQALNIPRLGDVTSRKLAEHPDIVKYLIEASVSFDEDINDYADVIGQANFRSILDNIQKFKRLNLIYDNIIWEEQKVESKGKVAITGKLSVKRAQFENELRLAGYTPGSIAKDTMFLITDDPNSSTSKNQKADEWGIIKITENDFRAQYMQ